MKQFLLFVFLGTCIHVVQAQKTDREDLIKGLAWIGSDSIIGSSFNEMKELNGNWISLVVYGDMQSYNDPHIISRKKHVWWGDSDQGIVKTANLAKEQGVKVMLKPHIALPNNTLKWRHDIQMESREDWVVWFASYEQWILEYAHLAQQHQMDMLCIGTELYHATTHYPEQWEKIIAKVRKVYSGKIVYAANWYKEIEELSFWQDLDYIGIQGYYPLSKKGHPKKSKLLKAWKKKKKSLRRLSEKYHKRVLFTEIGYKNTADATVTPWTWTKDITIPDISNETQKKAYEAFFETFWEEEWFQGVFVWQWHHTTYLHPDLDKYFEYRKQRLQLWSQQIGRHVDHRVDFSPQEKEAYTVLKHYFSKR